MRTKIRFYYLFITLALLVGIGRAEAQGTMFTYQGRLNTNTVPANGFFDFVFSLYPNALGTGTNVGSPITQTAIGVTNGLFTTTLNFGAVFSGSPLWLAISARSNGVGGYTALTPLQPLDPTPYAITAENLDGTLSANQLTGTLPAGLLSGSYNGTLNLNNSGDSFTGNGAGLSNVNALTLGGLAANNFWKTIGNAGTTPGANFLGTTDNQALELHADGNRALRIEPGSYGSVFMPNVIGGASINSVTSGIIGAAIGGGGETDVANPNSVGDNFGAIAGGAGNTILSGGNCGMIGGGYLNSVSGVRGFLGAGQNNTNNGSYAALAGGQNNLISGSYAAIPGGYNNQANGDYSFAAGQMAQALNNGSFVWADDSSSSPFSSTAVNQFLIRSSYVGINRTSPITGASYFDVHAPVTNQFGGMYVETAGTGLPFYGYAQNGSYTAFTYSDGNDANKWKLYNSGSQLTFTTGGALGVNTTTPSQALEVNGEFMMVDGLGGVKCYIGDDGFGNDVQIGSLTSGVTAVACYNFTDKAYMHLYCSSITIEGGADLAEPFPISKPDPDNAISPGAVMVIDDQNPGQLKMSDQPYDTRVAGVVSGANGINPGIQMQQQGLLEGGKNVALTGRVYVLADAAGGAIKPGDLLTTSATPGHAMKVTDHAKASGAILGKAMTGLKQGKGMVLVLVTLQ